MPPLLSSPSMPAAAPVAARPVCTATADAETARAALITQHLPLVRYVAGKLRRHADASVVVDFDDLVGFGTEGLIHAADTFDPSHGARFATWAVMHIRTTIQDALRVLDPLPRSVRQKRTAIEQASHQLAHTQGAWPTTAQVAAVLDRPVAEVRATVQAASRREVPLDVVEDGSADQGRPTWLAQLADEDPAGNPDAVVDSQDERATLRAAVAQLPAREARLIRMYYQEGQNMRAIGAALGVSESRVSQVHARALRLLRDTLTADEAASTALAA